MSSEKINKLSESLAETSVLLNKCISDYNINSSAFLEELHVLCSGDYYIESHYKIDKQIGQSIQKCELEINMRAKEWNKNKNRPYITIFFNNQGVNFSLSVNDANIKLPEHVNSITNLLGYAKSVMNSGMF